MTEEQIKQKFKETYPDLMRGDTPLSPYFDIWCYAIEIAEAEATKELQEENEKIYQRMTGLDKVLDRKDEQIDKMKCCFNCKHSRTEYEHCRTDKHEKWEIKE